MRLEGKTDWGAGGGPAGARGGKCACDSSTPHAAPSPGFPPAPVPLLQQQQAQQNPHPPPPKTNQQAPLNNHTNETKTQQNQTETDESGTTADALRRLRVPMERREALTRRDKMAREVDGWSAAALLEAFCARPRRALRVRAAVEVAGGGEGEAQEEVQEEGRRRKEPSRDDDAER